MGQVPGRAPQLRQPGEAEGEWLTARIIELAEHNVRTDVLRRWACAKWLIPPSDPRLLDLTESELLVLYYEDAVQEGRVAMGVDGRPLRERRTSGGESYYETGDPEIDRMEREFAERAARRDRDAGVLAAADGAGVDLMGGG